MAHTKM